MRARCQRRVRAAGPGQAGFTLLEICIVVTILAIVASVGVPQYVAALRVARIGKARHELVSIAHAVDAYATSNSGRLPLTLHQVGFGGRRDPWGVPYCYLNYGDGTGDGLEWAVAAGLVDPGAFKSYGDGGTRRAGFLPWLQEPGDDVVTPPRLEAARTSAAEIAAAVERPMTVDETATLAAEIASSSSFTVYLGVDATTTRRRDRYMFPLNTDYDLFSLGPNSRTAVSLGENVGLDDVIRANNGGFFGLASDY